MKKHLVLVCGIYHPQPSPTALCGERYVMLFRDNYDIDVIAWAQDGISREYVNSKGLNVHILSCMRLAIESRSKGWLKIVLHRMGSALLYLSFLGNQKWYVKAVSKKLSQIHNNYPIDVVFSVCSPISAHVGTTAFKSCHPDVRIIGYTVDAYSTIDRITPFGSKLIDLVNYEQNVLNVFDVIFLSEEIYENRPELRCGNHCFPLPYLMPQIFKYENVSKYYKEKEVHCVYAGSFYEEIRSPKYMLQIFRLLKNSGVYLHLYSKGCEDIVLRYSDDSNIIMHNVVPMEQLKEIYKRADVLVGVGNSMKEFLPSKTLEYVATKKPILYFNYPGFENSILKRYPYALQVEMSESMNLAAKKVDEFCKHSQGQIVNESTIMELYSKYTAFNIITKLSSAL